MQKPCSLPAALACVLFLTGNGLRAADSQMPSEPHQRSINTAIWTPGTVSTSFANFSGAIWGVPDGKVLVIEHISARVVVNPGEKVSVSVTCQGTGTGGLSSHQLQLTSAGVFDSHERLVGSSPFRCYTTGNLLVSFSRNSVAGLNVIAGTEFSFTGFLADPPK